jgi:hypothetical protein
MSSHFAVIMANFFFLDFQIYLQSVEIHSANDVLGGRRQQVEQCSVAPLCNKRVKTLCGCQEERVQTKVK